MNSINNVLVKIIIEGNLVQEPGLRFSPGGKPLCTLRLASNSFYRQDTGFEKNVRFFDVEAQAELAEYCLNEGRKGRGIRVKGRLKEARWKGRDGKSYSIAAVAAEHIAFKPYFIPGGGGTESPQSPPTAGP
ncbi:MAG: single-stranded DNA-binding protein [Treponema sp.]|jgi:single-strand DNA-binding protein|nr:single-stranded DNA-binding protein [Treponema sp.]